MVVSPGMYSLTGPQCMFKQMDGLRVGRCMDGESDQTQLGGEIQVFPCRNKWQQTFSFGNGVQTPVGSLHLNVPLHVQNRIQSKGKEQEPHMCIGVVGRGDRDEEKWDVDDGNLRGKEEAKKRNRLASLEEWEGEQVVTTRCSNVGAIIEWILVPFVHKDDAEYIISDDDTSKANENKLTPNMDTNKLEL